MDIRNFITETRWGAKSLVALYVSVLSGVVVALQYDPATPFFSTSTLEVLVPFGRFWRACHFYSSQLFFLCLVLHVFAVVLAKQDAGLKRARWLLLIGSLPLSLLLLFSGYVLRADATGEAAGVIAENITLAIPYLGNLFNSLLFAIDAEGMKRVYANHLIGLGVFWGICCWDHLRRYRVRMRSHGLWIAAMIFFSFLVAAPMEPARLGVFHIQGPWFFLGLQELLRYIQPFWAGVVFPSLLIAALAAVVIPSWRGRALLVVSGWCGLYLILSVISAMR
ncbi:cytochrome b N-terminal domain-containing protein [Thiovibrio sp. JS02]